MLGKDWLTSLNPASRLQALQSHKAAGEKDWMSSAAISLTAGEELCPLRGAFCWCQVPNTQLMEGKNTRGLSLDVIGLNIDFMAFLSLLKGMADVDI